MRVLFTDLLATWLDTVAAVALKPSGFKSNEAICRNHLVPAYGDMPIDMITAVGTEIRCHGGNAAPYSL